MRRTLIGIAAMTAAAQVGGFAHHRASASQFMQLYDYGHERKWPEPATLSRKLAEICGVPPTSIDVFPEPIAAFRAVGAALEPFYTADQPGEPTYDELMFPKPAPLDPDAVTHGMVAAAVDNAVHELDLADLDQLIDMATIGKFMQVHYAEELAGIRQAMLASLTEGEPDMSTADMSAFEAEQRAKEKQGEAEMDETSVEARTRAAQAAMDAETASYRLGGENVEADRQADDGEDAADAEAPAAAAAPDPVDPDTADAAPRRKKRT